MAPDTARESALEVEARVVTRARARAASCDARRRLLADAWRGAATHGEAPRADARGAPDGPQSHWREITNRRKLHPTGLDPNIFAAGATVSRVPRHQSPRRFAGSLSD